MKKKIVFLTGTRADYGKLKSLIRISQDCEDFDVHIFVTGMHMNSKYGKTVDEVVKSGFKNIYMFINHDEINHMDRTLAKTIDGFSHYIAETRPDMIVVHGDRVESLAGAIVGSLNNILVVHVEGGEISGTIDELIRHAVSKLAHIHLVSNLEAKRRLVQLGELEESIFIIGSPDFDIMYSNSLPEIDDAMKRYGVNFKDYAILLWHPVTTEYGDIRINTRSVVDAVIKSNQNYIVVFPNNDLGTIEILEEYKRFNDLDRVKVFPSIRFEHFLVFLKNSKFIIGNSSAGIREAPFYNVPTIDIGTRQDNRAHFNSVIHIGYSESEIVDAMNVIRNVQIDNCLSKKYFGEGNSDKLFFDLIRGSQVWNTSKQKQFNEVELQCIRKE
jgi:UDP-N-acetylglucosamine 2-epimerase (hydrolysing)